MPPEKITTDDPIPLDQLVGEDAAVQIVWFEADDPLFSGSVREAHRHDYHELFALTSGSMRHRIDDREVPHDDGTALLVGRGQLHVLEQIDGATGVLVRFSEELLTDAARQASPGWLLVQARSCVMQPPAGEFAHFLQLLRMLDDEIERPADPRSMTLQTYYLSATLLLVDRWQGAQTLDVPSAQNAEVEVFQNFARLLEAEFALHHDASWYASQLAVSTNHLAGTLTALTGRSTKSLISDRVMTEAQRLLRHTSLTVQQIALRIGYGDPLYFSRAFSKQVGLSPSAYRDRVLGAV